MNTTEILEQRFAEYLKPHLRRNQTIDIGYRKDNLCFDLVIKEHGVVTYIFEVKNHLSNTRLIAEKLSRIKEAYLYSMDGERLDIGLYLAVYDGTKWLIYDHNNLNKPLNIERIMRHGLTLYNNGYNTLKYICWVLGGVYTVAFVLYLCNFYFCDKYAEITAPIVTMGIFAAALLLLPSVLKCIKHLSLWNFSIELNEKEVDH